MWKPQLLAFTQRFKHPTSGLSHSQRVHELSLQLAMEQEVEVDRDLLFAAGYLHDIGAFERYKQPRVHHAETSLHVVDEILASVGFPLEKASLVKGIIQGHMFYANPVSRVEAVIFHDADTLDSMGAIGVTRLLSIVRLDDWTPDLSSAVKLIQRFGQELPEKLRTSQAREMGKVRQAEMIAYLTALSNETNGLEVP